VPDAIHPVAARGFGSSAERYERGRPGYPSVAVRWMVERLGVGPGRTVCDVGAGTGKLTRDLTPTGAAILAVEPIDEMAHVGALQAPEAEFLRGTAEHLPFADGAIDAITAGQAFHWFDHARAWAEFHRVLSPGGGVGLIWNARDTSVPWVREVWAIMDRIEKTAPWRDHDGPVLEAGRGFSPLESATFHHEVDTTPAAMIDRVASVSHVAVLPDEKRHAVLDEIESVLPPGVAFGVPYRVDVYVTHRQ